MHWKKSVANTFVSDSRDSVVLSSDKRDLTVNILFMLDIMFQLELHISAF